MEPVTTLEQVLLHLYTGLVMALFFATAGSCLQRRFGLGFRWVIGLTCIGVALWALSAESRLALAALLVCIVVSCWRRNPLLGLIKVAAWFALCFTAVFVLTLLGLAAVSGISWLWQVPHIFHRLFMMGMAYLLAPWLFLGGLPFGDETYSD